MLSSLSYWPDILMAPRSYVFQWTKTSVCETFTLVTHCHSQHWDYICTESLKYRALQFNHRCYNHWFCFLFSLNKHTQISCVCVLPWFHYLWFFHRPVWVYHNVVSGTWVVWVPRSWRWWKNGSVCVGSPELACIAVHWIPVNRTYWM